jgi:glyceraldehyde-3-phosphate dehydrogenase/erythrose-4-phosphate dehydrogenase
VDPVRLLPLRHPRERRLLKGALALGALLTTNSTDNSLDIVGITDPSNLGAPTRISLVAYGAGPNSVAFSDGVVAVAVESSPTPEQLDAYFKAGVKKVIVAAPVKGDTLNAACHLVREALRHVALGIRV